MMNQLLDVSGFDFLTTRINRVRWSSDLKDIGIAHTRKVEIWTFKKKSFGDLRSSNDVRYDNWFLKQIHVNANDLSLK